MLRNFLFANNDNNNLSHAITIASVCCIMGIVYYLNFLHMSFLKQQAFLKRT